MKKILLTFTIIAIGSIGSSYAAPGDVTCNPSMCCAVVETKDGQKLECVKIEVK